MSGLMRHSRPFMYWLGSPCYVSEFMRDSQVAIVDMSVGLVGRPIPAYGVVASSRGWGGLGAYNLAQAYRPEGL